MMAIILYIKKPNTRLYYLVISNTPEKSLDFSRVCNLLAEYGTKIHQDYASEAYYKEHYEVLIEGNALQSLSRL